MHGDLVLFDIAGTLIDTGGTGVALGLLTGNVEARTIAVAIGSSSLEQRGACNPTLAGCSCGESREIPDWYES